MFSGKFYLAVIIITVAITFIQWVFTGFLFLLYLFNYEIALFLIMNMDTFLIGIFLILTLALPVYFLVVSKMPKAGKGDSDVTDDYLNKIIESEEEDIDYEH